MKFLLLVALVVSAVQSESVRQPLGCSNNVATWTHHHSTVQSTLTMKCLKQGVQLTLDSPSSSSSWDTREVTLVAGYMKTKGPVSVFVAGSSPRCRKTISHSIGGRPPTNQGTPVIVTTPAPFEIEDDIFASMFGRKAAARTLRTVKSTTLDFDFKECGDEVKVDSFGCDASHSFHVQIIEVLSSSHPQITLPTTVLVPASCCKLIEQPPKKEVKPTLGEEEVAVCHSCSLGLTAVASPTIPSTTPNSISVAVTSNTCVAEPTWSWDIKRLNYASDAIIANNVPVLPLGSYIGTTISRTSTPYGYSVATDYVVLDSLVKLPITVDIRFFGAGVFLGSQNCPIYNNRW